GKQIGQAPIELDISLAALEELKMKLKGRVENLLANPQADLTMEVAEFSLRKIFAALGQAFPLATSDPKVLSRLAFAARIKADQTSLAVSDGKLKLDESALTVMLKIINFSKPDLAFDLTLDQIDADRYLPPKNSTRTNEGRMAAKSKTAGAKTAPPAAPAAKYVGTALAAVDGRLHAGKVTINQRAIENIRIIIKGKTGPIKFDLAARLQEGPLNVNGSIGPLGADAGRQVLPLDVAVNAVDQLKLRAGGNVLNPGAQTAVEMSVKIEEFSPRKLLAALGQPFPVDMPDPAAINRFALSANLKAASDRVSVSEGQVILDESKMKLNFHAKDFSKPDIAFDLAVDQINLDRYLPLQPQAKTDGKKKAESAGSSPQKATTESPAGGMESGYEPLRRLVLMGQLQAGKVTFNNLKIQNLRLKVSADKGVINLDPLNMNLYEGSVTGKSRISVQQKEPASGVDLSLNDVQIGPLLKDLASQDILEGVAQSRIDLALTGDSAERIRRTLSGQGAITINDGAVKGYDLASMARNVESAFGLGKKDTKAEARPRTDFTELQIPFTIASGIVDIAKASMKSPFIRLDASGKADLVKETIDFYVDPKAVATIKGQGDAKARSGILVPIIVSGTFAEPQLRPDIKRIITQQVDKGILESAPAKKIFEKEEVKKFEEPAKGLLKDLLKKP
ncbi:MAG: AsmA family protein, partial [Desulfobacterales bacterium]